MRALPQTLPANAALLATGVTSAGAACSLGGCCRLTRGVIVGDALALRVCLCVPTFRFRETEEAFMNATSSECSRGPGRLPACVPRGRGQRPGGCRPFPPTNRSALRVARDCPGPPRPPGSGARARAPSRGRPRVAPARGAGGRRVRSAAPRAPARRSNLCNALCDGPSTPCCSTKVCLARRFASLVAATRKPRTMCGMASTICAMLLVFSLDAANSWADIPYVSHDWHYSASVLILALAVALACLSVCAGACAHPLGSARFETVDRAAGMRRAMKRAADGETVARDVFRREWAPKVGASRPLVRADGKRPATPESGRTFRTTARTARSHRGMPGEDWQSGDHLIQPGKAPPASRRRKRGGGHPLLVAGLPSREEAEWEPESSLASPPGHERCTAARLIRCACCCPRPARRVASTMGTLSAAPTSRTMGSPRREFAAEPGWHGGGTMSDGASDNFLGESPLWDIDFALERSGVGGEWGGEHDDHWRPSARGGGAPLTPGSATVDLAGASALSSARRRPNEDRLSVAGDARSSDAGRGGSPASSFGRAGRRVRDLGASDLASRHSGRARLAAPFARPDASLLGMTSAAFHTETARGRTVPVLACPEVRVPGRGAADRSLGRGATVAGTGGESGSASSRAIRASKSAGVIGEGSQGVAVMVVARVVGKQSYPAAGSRHSVSSPDPLRRAGQPQPQPQPQSQPDSPAASHDSGAPSREHGLQSSDPQPVVEGSESATPDGALAEAAAKRRANRAVSPPCRAQGAWVPQWAFVGACRRAVASYCDALGCRRLCCCRHSGALPRLCQWCCWPCARVASDQSLQVWRYPPVAWLPVVAAPLLVLVLDLAAWLVSIVVVFPVGAARRLFADRSRPLDALPSGGSATSLDDPSMEQGLLLDSPGCCRPCHPLAAPPLRRSAVAWLCTCCASLALQCSPEESASPGAEAESAAAGWGGTLQAGGRPVAGGAGRWPHGSRQAGLVGGHPANEDVDAHLARLAALAASPRLAAEQAMRPPRGVWERLVAPGNMGLPAGTPGACCRAVCHGAARFCASVASTQSEAVTWSQALGFVGFNSPLGARVPHSAQPALPSWGRSASVLRGWVTHGRAGIFLWVLMAVAIYAWRNAALADGSTGWLGARDAGIAAMTTKLFALVVVPLDSASYLRFLILDLPIKLIAGFTLHGLDDPGGYHSLAGAVTWETMLSIAFGFLVRSTELQSREHFAAGCNAARQRRQLQSLQLQLVETDRESREAVLVLDPVTARVVSASPSCTRLLGWLPSEFMASQNIYELLVDLDMLPLALDMAVADRLHWLRMFPGKPFGVHPSTEAAVQRGRAEDASRRAAAAASARRRPASAWRAVTRWQTGGQSSASGSNGPASGGPAQEAARPKGALRHSRALQRDRHTTASDHDSQPAGPGRRRFGQRQGVSRAGSASRGGETDGGGGMSLPHSPQGLRRSASGAETDMTEIRRGQPDGGSRASDASLEAGEAGNVIDSINGGDAADRAKGSWDAPAAVQGAMPWRGASAVGAGRPVKPAVREAPATKDASADSPMGAIGPRGSARAGSSWWGGTAPDTSESEGGLDGSPTVAGIFSGKNGSPPARQRRGPSGHAGGQPAGGSGGLANPAAAEQGRTAVRRRAAGLAGWLGSSAGHSSPPPARRTHLAVAPPESSEETIRVSARRRHSPRANIALPPSPAAGTTDLSGRALPFAPGGRPLAAAAQAEAAVPSAAGSPSRAAGGLAEPAGGAGHPGHDPPAAARPRPQMRVRGLRPLARRSATPDYEEPPGGSGFWHPGRGWEAERGGGSNGSAVGTGAALAGQRAARGGAVGSPVAGSCGRSGDTHLSSNDEEDGLFDAEEDVDERPPIGSIDAVDVGRRARDRQDAAWNALMRASEQGEMGGIFFSRPEDLSARGSGGWVHRRRGDTELAAAAAHPTWPLELTPLWLIRTQWAVAVAGESAASEARARHASLEAETRARRTAEAAARKRFREALLRMGAVAPPHGWWEVNGRWVESPGVPVGQQLAASAAVIAQSSAAAALAASAGHDAAASDAPAGFAGRPTSPTSHLQAAGMRPRALDPFTDAIGHRVAEAMQHMSQARHFARSPRKPRGILLTDRLIASLPPGACFPPPSGRLRDLLSSFVAAKQPDREPDALILTQRQSVWRMRCRDGTAAWVRIHKSLSPLGVMLHLSSASELRAAVSRHAKLAASLEHAEGRAARAEAQRAELEHELFAARSQMQRDAERDHSERFRRREHSAGSVPARPRSDGVEPTLMGRLPPLARPRELAASMARPPSHGSATAAPEHLHRDSTAATASGAPSGAVPAGAVTPPVEDKSHRVHGARNESRRKARDRLPPLVTTLHSGRGSRSTSTHSARPASPLPHGRSSCSNASHLHSSPLPAPQKATGAPATGAGEPHTGIARPPPRGPGAGPAMLPVVAVVLGLGADEATVAATLEAVRASGFTTVSAHSWDDVVSMASALAGSGAVRPGGRMVLVPASAAAAADSGAVAQCTSRVAAVGLELLLAATA